MLFLFTGTPGASKTLNAIKFVNEDDTFAIFKDGKKTDARRPVYYFNMREVQLPWTELSLEEAMKWYDLPEGSVIIFDEAYDVFPQRLRGEAPEQVKKLAVHRHKGFDIIIICQKVSGQVDSFVRGLINRHYHMERRFGTNMVTRYEWQKCCENVNDYHSKKDALTKSIRIDPKYFGTYHSAEVHTVKSNVPWRKLAVIPLTLFFVVGAIWFGVNTFMGGSSDEGETVASGVGGMLSGSPASAFNSKFDEKLDFGEYVAQYTPRIDGLPHTAPAYDEVTKPKTYPRLACIVWRPDTKYESCKCLTQQGTTVKVPASTCKNMANNGMFDPAREDPEMVAERNRRDEMQYRVAMETAANAGLNPVEEYEKQRRGVYVVGNVRPYDHFFAGTGVARTAPSRSESSQPSQNMTAQQSAPQNSGYSAF